jgi:uncharacterized damage-inducible protein DinB
MAITPRRDGGVGAMLDEHERAARELLAVIGPLSDEAFAVVRDRETVDENCRSIRTVVSHVVRSGYAYANYIRGALGAAPTPPAPQMLEREEVPAQMERMLVELAAALDGRHRMTDDEITATRMLTRWGVTYDLEQMLEHAIVHVLRHRRQIERFLER